MVIARNDIVFPDKHYVGYRLENKGPDQYYTGFMTPHGTDAAAAKRIQSVDTWVNQGRARHNGHYDWQTKTQHPLPDDYGTDHLKDGEVFDNTAMDGFTIGDRLNRGGSYSGSQDKWKINDPRGFQLEITGSNLARIIEHCTIIEGVIQEKLIWAREKTANVLVPVTTELYKTAVVNTERMSKSVSPKDLKPGDLCLMRDGRTLFYHGRWNVVHLDDEKSVLDIKVSKPQYIFSQTGEHDSCERFRAISSPKVSEVISSEPDKSLTMWQINHVLWEGKPDRGRINGNREDGYALCDPKSEVKLVWINNPSGPPKPNFYTRHYRFQDEKGQWGYGYNRRYDLSRPAQSYDNTFSLIHEGAEGLFYYGTERHYWGTRNLKIHYEGPRYNEHYAAIRVDNGSTFQTVYL